MPRLRSARRNAERETRRSEHLALNAQRAFDDMCAAGLRPLGPYPGAAVPWQCRCLQCGEVVASSVRAVRKGHGGCGSCGQFHKTVQLAIRAYDTLGRAGLTPIVPYPGAAAPWRCYCDNCGFPTTVKIDNLGKGHPGCPYCLEIHRHDGEETA